MNLLAKQHWYWRIGVWLLFFTLYAATAAPSIVTLYDDSLELQLVGPTFGIAHPTGYPLYILLSGLWSRVLFPLGNWAWRMNLFSVLAAATTVTLLFSLTQRFLENQSSTKRESLQSTWAALAAALTFGLSPVWWSQATLAEVYPLHNLFVAALLLFALNLLISQSPNLPPTPPRPHPLTPFFLLLGLALTHHRTIVLILPGLAVMLWPQRRYLLQRRWWLQWAMALCLPLLIYLFIPLRAGMGVYDLHGSYVNSWQGFWNHVLARGYTGFFTPNALAVQHTLGDWWRLWQAQFGLVGLGVGVLGILWLAWKGRPIYTGLGLLIVLLTNLLFAVNYQVGDQEVFLLPAWLCFACCIGIGVNALFVVVNVQPRLAQGLAVGCCLLLLVGVGGRGALVNRSQDWAVHDYAVAMAKVDFPPDSRVIALEGQATALTYMQAAEGVGLNALPVIADTPDIRQAAVATAVAQGHPTYITQEVEGIAEHYSFSGEGPLVRVWPRGQASIGIPRHALSQSFADGALQLTGYDLEWLAEAGGSTLRIAFYWRPTTAMTQVYKLSLRLLNGDQVILQEDRYPLRLTAPTTSWLPGETIRDIHYLKSPISATAQTTQLRVILYDEASVAEAGVVDLPTLP